MFPPPGFSEPTSQQQDNAKAIFHDAHAPAAHDCIYLNPFDEWGRIIIYFTRHTFNGYNIELHNITGYTEITLLGVGATMRGLSDDVVGHGASPQSSLFATLQKRIAKSCCSAFGLIIITFRATPLDLVSLEFL
jgi:hypothetical protein